MSDTVELGNKYLMNTYKRLPLVVTQGENVYLYDENGKKYLDFVAGIAVNTLGYTNEGFVDALCSQAALFNHCSNLYYNKPQVELAQTLVEHSSFETAFFCNSGTESVEAALKLVRKYGNTCFKVKKTKIIAMKNSFHGRTYGSMSATGQSKYQKSFTPLVPDFFYAEFNSINSVKRLVDNKTCAILVEPVQGEGGVLPADKGFMHGLRQLCDENEILLIFDEVQCGVGRTGKLFAYEHYGTAPDIICLAKGLGNGIPIGAMLANNKASEIFTYGDHASTFGGNPIACTCANYVLNELINKNLLSQVADTGNYLKLSLQEMGFQFPVIKEVRGMGLMIGVEFTVPVESVIKLCQEKGLLLIASGTNVIRFLPPLVVTNEHVKEAVNIFRSALEELNLTRYSF